ncbi:ATP/GTP-binding protein [Streptomyces sp. NPDC101455]|uniref:ATP/GTP-binding protein n=1 Tax=Streptomyces sp. NPDC101455 TaxID=3366142 RepID=UPI00382B3189
MAGRDLRALFSTNDRGLTAQEAFTNRESQWDAVTAALTEHLGTVNAPSFDVEDLETPRTNVLVFHGVGGVGKTTLSRKVEGALADGEHLPAQWSRPGWSGVRILPVRIDLARSAGSDFERIVLSIRLALAELGRPLPAFDLALRRYWEANHPGEPLEDYLRRSGLVSRLGQALPQQMQSALADAAQTLMLPGTIGAVVGQVTGALVGALREQRQTVRALAGCARFADLLEAEPDLDALSYYPHLLAWELSRLPHDKRTVPVVLLDTFEDIGDRTLRDLERLVQRVVWLMPNALFVITGRSRLQWADPALQGQLDYTGPAAWPGLTAPAVPPARTGGSVGQGRQVLVGDFSPEDCDDYLARRLARNGRPLISEPVRRTITGRSHGLPLYLDLSVMRFLELRRTGHVPQPADFDHDFPALVSRTLSDLTADERHVLRSVSLLDSFDVPLATQAAGMTRDAAALRLTERPFVRENPAALWPFHLHGLVRSTIRTADDHTDDRWSPADWEQAAHRAFRALGEQWRTAPDDDRSLLAGALRQGLALARDFRLELGWLTDAAWRYVGDSVWEPIAPPTPTATAALPLETPADALVETLSALARRQHEHRETTVARLTAVAETGLLPAELQEMALYYRAKAYRDIGRSADSRRGYQQVADGAGRLAPAARRGLAQAARLAGDFPTAYQAAQTLGWDGRHQRVLGDLWWLQGEPVRAAAAYQAGRIEAEQHATTGEAAHNQALRALAVAFYDPQQAGDEIDLAEQLLAAVDLRATRINTVIAALIRDAGTPALDDRVRALRTELDVAGLTSMAPVLELALAFHQAALDDHAGLFATVSRLRELTQDGDGAYYIDIVHFMAGLPLPAQHTAPQWLDGEEATRGRWHALVVARRRHLGILG